MPRIIKISLALIIFLVPSFAFALDTNCNWTYSGWQCTTREDSNEILRRGLDRELQPIDRLGGYINPGQRLTNDFEKYLNERNNTVVQKTPDESCKQSYGQYSYYTNQKNENGGYVCDCMNGYAWNTNQAACIKKVVEQNNNIQNSGAVKEPISSGGGGGVGGCNDGYIMVNGKCISHTEDCQKYYGKNVYGAKGSNKNSNCYCSSGYEWNQNRTACIQINNGVFYFGEAQKKSDEKKYAEAIPLYTLAIQSNNPQKDSYYVRRGSMYVELGKCAEAIKDFESAIKINSDNAYIYFHKGIRLIQLKKYSCAINFYDKAIEMKKKYSKDTTSILMSEIYQGKADAYKKLGNLKDAKKMNEMVAKEKSKK